MLYHVCLSLCFETTRSHSAHLNSTNARVKSAHYRISTHAKFSTSEKTAHVYCAKTGDNDLAHFLVSK